MPFQDTVNAATRLAITSSAATNLSNSMIIDLNSYFSERIVNFSSIAEVNASQIAKDGKLYGALVHAFAQPNAKTPIYVGRRNAATTTLTPTVNNTTTYSVTLQAINTTDNSVTDQYDAEYTSDADATAVEITAGLLVAINALAIPATELTVTDTAGTLVVTPAANRNQIVTEVANMSQTFSTIENAADCYTEITTVNNEDFYYVCTTQRDHTFVIDLAGQIAATGSSNKPKIFRVSDNNIASILAQEIPSNTADLLGKIEDLELGRVSTEWHDQSDTLFPELAAFVYQGSFFAGTQTFKFMVNNTTPQARHPLLGRPLTPSEVGHILDRNSSVATKERGNTLYHGGSLASSSTDWIDNQIIADWITDTIEVRVLDVFLNRSNAGLPITFTKGDISIIKNTVDNVLVEGVERKMLSGFEACTVPSNISFTDQAGRLLKDVKWVGYLAGKAHFAIIDGSLTYNEEIA